MGKNAWNSTVERLETGEISGTYWTRSLIKKQQALGSVEDSRNPEDSVSARYLGMKCVSIHRDEYTPHIYMDYFNSVCVCAYVSVSLSMFLSLSLPPSHPPPRFYMWMCKPEVNVRCFPQSLCRYSSSLLRPGACWLSKLAGQQAPGPLLPPTANSSVQLL